MEISEETIQKMHRNPTEMSQQDFLELKKMFQVQNKRFIDLLKKILAEIKNKEQLPAFFFLMEHLKDEMTDISPFLSHHLNRLFRMMLDFRYYKKIAGLDFLLLQCGNLTTLRLLKQLIVARDIEKFITGLEIYKLKKVIFELSGKFDKKDEITYKIQMEIAAEDTRWLENMEDILGE